MGRAVFDDDEPLSMATTDLSPERPIREGSSSRGPAQEGGLPELFDAVRWRWRPTMLIALLFFLGATHLRRAPPRAVRRQGACSRSLRASVVTECRRGHGSRRRTEVRGVRHCCGHRSAGGPQHRRGPADAAGRRRTRHLATDTGNVTITVRLPSPARAARAANAFADSALAFSQTDKQLDCRVSWRPRLRPATRRRRRGACSRPRRSSSA